MARKCNVSAAALCVCAMLVSGAALAQSSRDAMPDPSVLPSPTTPAIAPLSDRKMEQFVNAYLEVQSIQQSATADLKAASGPEKIEAVKQKAEGDMVAAVERSGLAIAEFNQIVQTMQADENVRSQIAAKLEARGKSVE